MHASKIFCNFAPSNKNNNSKTFRTMKTKKELAIEILGSYENYGCELKQQVFDKVLARLTQCKKYALEEVVRLVRISADKKREAAYCIYVLTGCKLA